MGNHARDEHDVASGGATSLTRRKLMKTGAGSALAFTAAGWLAACGGGQGGAAGGSKTASYANKNLDFFFYAAELAALKRAYASHGYKFETTDAKGDAGTQFNQWNSTLLKKPAFLISNPIDTENLIPLTKKADNLHVPVGVIDTPLTGGSVDFTIAFDNRMGGQMAGEKTVELLKKKYDGHVKGKVLNLYGALSASVWRDRKEGFESAFKQYPDVTVVSRPTETLQEKARAVTGATLSQFPDLDAIHAPTDSLTQSIMPAMRGAGRLAPVGEAKHVILTSIDGDPIALGWIRDKILDAEVSQDPVAYCEICVEMLVKYSVKGKPVPLGTYKSDRYVWGHAPVVHGASGPRMVLPPYFADAKNADDPRQWANRVTKWGLKEQ